MKTLIVGGNFGNIPKKSEVINKIALEFEDNKTINGGLIQREFEGPGDMTISIGDAQFTNKSVCLKSKILLADGEMFSWYGSRLAKAAQYLQVLINSITQK